MRASSTEEEIQIAYRGNKNAAGYIQQRFLSPVMARLHRIQVDSLHEQLQKHRPTSILEIAPGPGRITRDILASGRLVCLEYNLGMIEEGKAACNSSVEWVQGNAFELPFDDGQFDFVYSFRFIRHFHRADRDRLYGQIHRVLQPGGLLTFDAVNKVVSQPLRDANPEAYPIYDKLYGSVSEMRDELSQAGFDLVEALPVQRRYALQSTAQNLLGPRSRILCRLALEALERLPGGSPLEWIVTCRRA